jgi:hypothetical protein
MKTAILLIMAVAISLTACKKRPTEFTKIIQTEGDVEITIPYAEINQDGMFKKKAPKTDYKVEILHLYGEWQRVDPNDFGGGYIEIVINPTTGDLLLDMKFAPFPKDQTFKIIITE